MSTTSEIRQECPNCGGTIIVKNRELIGRKITCPKCKKAVLVQDDSPKKNKPAKKRSESDDGVSAERKDKKAKKTKKAGEQSQVKLLLFVGGGLLAIAAAVLVVFLFMSGSGGDNQQAANNLGGAGQAGAGGGPGGQHADQGGVNVPGGPQAGPSAVDADLKDLESGDPQKVQKARQKLIRELQSSNQQVRRDLIKKLQDLAVKMADRDSNEALRVLELANRSLRSTNQEVRRELADAISEVRRQLRNRLGNWQAHATNLIPNDTQMFVHIPVARLLRGFPQQMLFEQGGFQPQDFEQQLGVELGQVQDIVVAGLPTRNQCMIVVTTKMPLNWERVAAALNVKKESRQTRAGKEYYLGQAYFLNEFLGGRFPLASLREKAAVHLDGSRKTLVIAHEELLAAWLEKPPEPQWRLAAENASGAQANLPPADFGTFLTLNRDFRLLVDRIDREGPYALLYGEWRVQRQSKELLAGIQAWLQWLPEQFRLIAKDLQSADGLAFALVQLPEAPIAVNLAMHATDLKAAERIKALALRTKLPAIRKTLSEALAANVIVRDLDTELQAPPGGETGGGFSGGESGGVPPPDASGSGPMGQPMPPGPPAGGGSAPGGGADVGPGGGMPPIKPISPNIGGGGSAPGGGGPPPGIKPMPPNIGGGAPGPGGGSAPGGAVEGPAPGVPEGGYSPQPGGGRPPADDFPRDPNKPDLTILIQQADEYVQIIFGLREPTGPLVEALEEQLIYAKGELHLRSRPFRIHDLGRAANAYPPNHSRTFPPGALLGPGETYGIRGQFTLEERISFFRELLPYLDDDRYRQLYAQIDPSKPWLDEQNLKAARVLVPHFLHPNAPPFYGAVRSGDRDIRVALTHFVGMAGVGPNAPFYRKDDPRAGIFGDPAYRGPTTLDDIRDGTSNTILLIQTDSRLAGPWIQGGGATMRGTSFQGNDVGRPYGFLAPPHGGKTGTFAVMADGSVRFITRDISVDVFKALCTMAGGETLPPLDHVAPPVPSHTTEVSGSSRPEEKAKPSEKPSAPISRRDPWTPDPALVKELAAETPIGSFVFRPPAGYRKEESQPASSNEVSARWVGRVHEDVGVAPAIMVSLTPLDTRLAGQPLEQIVKEIIARFPKEGGKWEFDSNIEQNLIQGKLFARVACRFLSPSGQHLTGYYYQHTDGQVGLGILIVEHPNYAAGTIPLLETSVATFRKR